MLRGLLTVVWPARERFHDDAVELHRYLRHGPQAPRLVFPRPVLHDRVIVVAVVRVAPRDELVEQNAGCEHVASSVEPLSAELLRRHVASLADEATRGEVVLAASACDSEI